MKIKSKIMIRVFAILLLLSFSIVPSNNLISFLDRKTELYGLKNAEGRIILQAKYPRIEINKISKGRAIVFDSEIKEWILVNEKGEYLHTILPFDNGPDAINEGAFRFTEKGKIGFLNTKSQIIIPAKYDFAYPFTQGVSIFCTGCAEDKNKEHTTGAGGLWGVINKMGQIVIAVEHKEIEYGDKGYIYIERETNLISLDSTLAK